MYYQKLQMQRLSVKEKVKNKIQLQKDLGLNEDPNAMLIGIVSRLTDQKGLTDRICNG